MSPLTYIKIPTELFVLPLTGRYEMSIVALAYNFDGKGLRMSNGKLAEVMRTSSRTVERVIARLRRNGVIEDTGTGKNDRCLRLTADTMSVVSTGIMSGADTDRTADHNKRTKGKCAHKPAKPVCDDEAFDRFWQIYPKKVAKKDARKSWAKLKPSPEIVETILAALERQKQTEQWTKEGGRFIPKPTTWLNGERWQDEIESTTVAEVLGCGPCDEDEARRVLGLVEKQT